MRYFFLFFVSVLFSFPTTAEDSVLNKAELRVLDIGNSYTNDATSLLPLIANASKADLSTMCLYKCVRGSASFKNWVDVYNDKDSTKNYTIKKIVGGLPANVQTGSGEAGDGKLFRKLLSNENWDIIIIHQYSLYAPYYSKWNTNSSAGYLDALISIIKEHQPNAKLGFLLVHSYWSGYARNTEQSSYDRWQLIANSTKSFCEDYGVDFVIPYGTAIQNLRLSSLNNEYDLTRDGTHCGYGLAQYTAACCYYESLIAPRCGISVLGNPARIDVSDKETKYPSVNVTDENALIAQKAAYLAVWDMYNCQNPEQNVFKLTYLVDGEVFKSDSVEYNSTLTPIAEPTKEGYTFSGWSEIPETMPAHDVEVNGTFTINKYLLTYKVDGEVFKSDSVEYNSTLTPIAEPTKEGYSFSGWSEIPETMPAHDVEVNGSFTINKYLLTYKVDGEVFKSDSVEYNSTLTPIAEPTKEGYSFSGWSEIPETMPAHDVEINGSFTVNKYLLTYKVDGEVFKSDSIEYNSTLTPIAEPTKEGYTFSGWSEIPETMPAHDVTVTGTFTQTVYSIGDDTYEITGEGTVTIKGSNQTGSVEISGIVEINGYTYHVIAIGENAFKENTEITSVTIGNGIMTVGDNAFNGCSHLKNINIGKDVNAIGHKTFANIGTASSASTRSNEASITVNSYAVNVSETATDAFENAPIETGLLLVEDSSVDAYKTASPWSGFGTILGNNEAASINYISNDLPRAVVYDMQGRRINHLQKGMNIIRSSDGKTKKVIVKREVDND